MLSLQLKLNSAAADNDTDAVLNAITEGADINALVSVIPGAKAAKSALMSAAAHGSLDMVEFLLQLGADPSLVAPNGDTALSLAQQYTHAAIVECLRVSMQWQQSATPTEVESLVDKAQKPSEKPRYSKPKHRGRMSQPKTDSGSSTNEHNEKKDDDMTPWSDGNNNLLIDDNEFSDKDAAGPLKETLSARDEEPLLPGGLLGDLERLEREVGSQPCNGPSKLAKTQPTTDSPTIQGAEATIASMVTTNPEAENASATGDQGPVPLTQAQIAHVNELMVSRDEYQVRSSPQPNRDPDSRLWYNPGLTLIYWRTSPQSSMPPNRSSKLVSRH